jgi:predicted transcriptional regulator
MKTLTFEVSSPTHAMANFAQQLTAGVPDSSTRIIFASQELLTQVVSDARWDILKRLCGAGSMPIKVIAAELGRDVAEVEVDIHALFVAGVLEPHDGDKVIFPYDQISLDLPTTGRTTV